MLNSLEDELGIRLIARNRNGVKPTAAGKSLLPYIRNVISENNSVPQAVSEISGMLKGSIVIGSVDTAPVSFLPGIIKDFQEIYPNIEINLKNGSYEENEYWLINKDVDCGFVTIPTIASFSTIPVIQDRLVIVSGKKYKLDFTNPDSVTKEDLLNEKIILVDRADTHEISRIFSSEINVLAVSIMTGSLTAFIKMMLCNLGVGLLPSTLAEEFSDLLNMYELKNKYSRTLSLAYRNKKEISPVTKKFIEFVSES